MSVVAGLLLTAAYLVAYHAAPDAYGTRLVLLVAAGVAAITAAGAL